MMPEAAAPALAALAKAVDLAPGAPAKDRALIAALQKRYSADPKAERAALDAAFADAMKSVAEKYPGDDTVLTLYAESVMDTQAWDYWEAGGTKPKGRAAELLAALERCSHAIRITRERSTSTSTRSRRQRSPIARCHTRDDWPR
jgi:hypothetical protein